MLELMKRQQASTSKASVLELKEKVENNQMSFKIIQ
jgi:hypothetical protein